MSREELEQFRDCVQAWLVVFWILLALGLIQVAGLVLLLLQALKGDIR